MARVQVRMLALGAAVGLLAAACGSDGSGTAGPLEPTAAPAPTGTPEPVAPPADLRPSPSPTSDQPTPLPPERQVPEILAFEAPAIGGGQIVGAELAGQAVALWFWAPW